MKKIIAALLALFIAAPSFAAGPIAGIVRLPDDSGNPGPKMRTQTKVIGANTTHEQFFILARQANVIGTYRVGMAQQTIAAAAQNGTSTGFLWFHVPIAVTGKRVRIRKIRIESQHSTALATPTAPRLAFTRMTFTGTASGAAVTVGKIDSLNGTASVADLRTAVTGLTPSLVALLGVAGIVGAITAAGSEAPTPIELIDTASEDEWWTFGPGEGLVIWQDVAGTTADTRKVNINIIWDDIDVQ